MNDDGRGGDQYRLHRELFAKTLQSCGRFDFYQREEGAEHGRTQQPSRGDESWLHPAQQQRDGSREKPRDHGSAENRRERPRFLRYAKKAFPVERSAVSKRAGREKKAVVNARTERGKNTGRREGEGVRETETREGKTKN